MTDFLDSFDSFDETDERYFIVKDQFGKECWYDPQTETMTPLYPDGESQGKAIYEPRIRRIKFDEEPWRN